MPQAKDAQLEPTRKSLERMQQFDSSKLPRTEELGSVMSFQDVVEPANRLIELYKQLTVAALEQFPTDVLKRIQQQADSDYNQFDAILNFTAGRTKPERDQQVQKIVSAYQPAFTALHPFISYSTRTVTDFSRLEREARAHLQSAKDSTDALQSELKKQRDEMQTVLEAIRKTAAEQGVSQQAIYFKGAADDYQQASSRWLMATVCLTVMLALYAVATLFLHKWMFLAPSNVYETAQLAVSKALVFVTISFALMLSAKNYLANRHNAVVNQHRQNALVTYRALVESAGVLANRDVVLTKAADCIFTAQPTAFSKFESVEGGSVSLVNVPGGINQSVN